MGLSGFPCSCQGDKNHDDFDYWVFGNWMPPVFKMAYWISELTLLDWSY
jgi:hypothetical protein